MLALGLHSCPERRTFKMLMKPAHEVTLRPPGKSSESGYSRQSERNAASSIRATPFATCAHRKSSQSKNNYSRETWRGSEAASYLRLVGFYSKEEEEEGYSRHSERKAASSIKATPFATCRRKSLTYDVGP